MRVLQVNCVYGKGSTGKIVRLLHRGLLEAGHESRVFYGRGEVVRESGVEKCCSELEAHGTHVLAKMSGLMYGGAPLATRRLLHEVERWSPDVVHLHCVNGYFVNIYRLLSRLKDLAVPTVLTLHAEFMYTANCGHAYECDRWILGCGACPRFRQETGSLVFDGTARSWRRMAEAYKGFDHLVVVSVSPWLMGRAKSSPMLADKEHLVIGNPVDESVFFPRYEQPLQVGKVKGKKVVFHATPSFTDAPGHLKGGEHVLTLARRMPDVVFVVAGPHRLSGEVPPNVVLLGSMGDQDELARWYTRADVTLLTSKRETFSMVTAESLCCGTPVVGYRAGGPESIAVEGAATFVRQGDVDALEAACGSALNCGLDAAMDSIAGVAAKAYSQRTCLEQHVRLYERLRR